MTAAEAETRKTQPHFEWNSDFVEGVMLSRLLSCSVLVVTVALVSPLVAQTVPPHEPASSSKAQYRFKAAGEHSAFEWFFLVVDAAKRQGIWAENGVAPEFVPAAGSATQIKERVDSGVKIGFANTAEVTLARANGVAVKAVAGYFGKTGAKIFVAAHGSAITNTKDLDGKKIGIVATTHTSYRTVFYMNKKLGIKSEPVPLGSLSNNLEALKSGKIDAFYSAEGAALILVDSGDIRLLLPLSDIYPKPYTAVVVWATDDLIEQSPDLVKRFVKGTLQAVQFLQTHPSEASELYISRMGASKNVADKAVAALNQVLTPSGRGSEADLLAAVAGNWQFITESGAVPANTAVKLEDVVDGHFLPPR